MTFSSLQKTFPLVLWGNGNSQICVDMELSQTDSSLKGVQGVASVSTSRTCLLKVVWNCLWKCKFLFLFFFNQCGNSGNSYAALSYSHLRISCSILLSRFLLASALTFSKNVELWLNVAMWLSRRCSVSCCLWTQSKNKVMKIKACHVRDEAKWLMFRLLNYGFFCCLQKEIDTEVEARLSLCKCC